MGFLFWRRHEEEEAETEELGRMVKYAAELHGVSTKEVVSTVLDDDDFDDEEMSEDDDEAKPRRKFRAGPWVVFVVVGIIFGLGIVALMKLSSMATGPSATSGVQAFNASIAPTPQANPSFSSPSLTFTYPAVFDTVVTEPNWSDTTERYMIGSTSDYRRTIAIEIEDNAPLPRDDSGFQFRSEPDSGYTAVPVTVEGTPATVMVKSDSTERTLYWAHAGMLVIMSVVSTNGTDNLPQFMSLITKSLRWNNT